MTITDTISRLIKKFAEDCEKESVKVSVATLFNDGDKTITLILENEENSTNYTFRPEG